MVLVTIKEGDRNFVGERRAHAEIWKRLQARGVWLTGLYVVVLVAATTLAVLKGQDAAAEQGGLEAGAIRNSVGESWGKFASFDFMFYQSIAAAVCLLGSAACLQVSPWRRSHSHYSVCPSFP